MKLHFTFYLMTLMATNAIQAQYSETFDVPNKGILAGPCTTNDPTTCTSFDFAGVDWTLEGDLSGLTAADDNFFTEGGVLRAMDVDEEICWFSPVLNMTGTASFAMDLTWLQFDDYDISADGSKDYIDVSYRIDGGSWITLPNLVGGGPRTISYVGVGGNINGSTSLNVTALTGSTLQIQVCVDVNSAQEIVTLDNVSAVNATTGTSGPDCDLVLNNTTKTDEDCPGANDGTITVNATTSNGPITYTLSGPVNASNQTGIFTSLPPGDYSVALQDGSFAPGTCTESTGTITIAAGVDSNPPSGQVQPITVDCPGDIPAPDITEVTNVDDNCMIPCVTEPWINEFHYDNIGTDDNEFIEVAGPAGIDLSIYTLYVYDGSNGAFYNSFALSGSIPDEDNGFGAAFVLTPNLQNQTEGIALVKNGTEVIEFISYEGTVTATDGPANGMTSVDVGVAESNDATPTNGSLGRIGSGNKPGDFTWAVLTQTQGTLNTGQTISDCPDNEPTVAHFSDANNGGAGSGDDPYIVTRTYRITDAAGNTADVTQTLTANNCCPTYTDNIAYVNLNATGANNGTSWTDAFTDLQDALNSNCSGITEIWVAAGTYKPTSGTDRSISFVMKNGVAIYGGFPNTGNPGMGDRDWVTHETILSGDLNGDDGPNFANNSENSYHVIFNNNNGLDDTAILDGFTISGGNADGAFPHNVGGGMLNLASSPHMNNCIFSGNAADQGGGIYANSALNLTDCTISGNKASGFGGGIFSWGVTTIIRTTIDNNEAVNAGGIFQANSNLTMTNCKIINNVTVFQGAGINLQDCPNATLINCLISGNQSTSSQAGIAHLVANGPTSNLTLTNCTVADNEGAPNGFGGVWTAYFSDTPGLSVVTQLENTIVANNFPDNFTTTVGTTYTPVPTPNSLLTSIGHNLDSDGSSGFTDGVNGDIVGQDPLFVSNTDFRLQACSPAINAGNNAAVPIDITTDLDGNPRFYNSGIVDMGAYEYQGEKHVDPTDGGEIAASQTVCSGELPAPFTSLSAPTGFVGDLEYQWQLNTISATASFNDWEDVGTNTDTYDLPGAITQTTWFRRLARVGCVTDTWETATSSNVLEIATYPIGLRTWTGTTDNDWNTAGNWDPPCVPTAADDVIIPDVTNEPVIYAGIAAVAKSVTVNEDASLAIEATGSLTINGSAIHEFDFYAGLYNRGAVTNDGLISLGAVSSVGDIGLWNLGTFSNNSEIQINRSTLAALWSAEGQFTNSSFIYIGASASVDDYGLYNDASFINTADGQIVINNFTYRGLENRTGAIDNSGGITIGFVSGSGERSIMNQAVINNHPGGEISLDRATAAGVYNDVSGQFINASSLNIGGTVSVGQYGIQNIGTFTNTLNGEIFIDLTAVMGLYNNGGGSKFTNEALLVIGNTASVGLFGIGNEGVFNNTSSGEIQVDRSTNIGFSSVGPVTNSGLIKIGSQESVGVRGIQNAGSAFTNTITGEIHIDRTTELGLFNGDAQFQNDGKMFLGANHPIGGRGINNQGASNSFLNSATGEITIDRTTEYAFVNANHTNENAGKLTIGSHAAVDEYGIFLFFSAGLNNTGAGEIRIDRTSNSGIYVETGSTFTNDATIIIGEAEPYTATYCIQNEGIFTNGPCAVIRTYAPLSNLTNFTNNGLLTAITTEQHAGIAVVVNSPGGVAGAYNFAAAGFGGDVGGGVWTADAVVVSDAGASSLGCNAPYQNAAQLAGKIALIDRGICQFGVKCLLAEQAGAIAVVIINNVAGPPFIMGAGDVGDQVTIPCVLISQADGDAIKAAGNVNMSIGNIATPANAIINNGILEFPLGNSIPSIENNQVVVEPFSGDCSAAISPALRLDDAADFVIADTWYFDENLTNVAGTYDMGTNTFVPDGALAGDVTTLYFNITDPVGGCTRTVSVQASFNDDIIPDAVCKDITVELQGNSVTVFAADVDDGSTDNCTLAEELIFTPASVTYTCDDIGVNTFVLTVTDAKGNSNFCIASVTVVDATPPQISCADPVEVLTDPFENFASNVIIGVATGTDNCGVPDIEGVRSDALGLNDPYPVGLTTITWTATDGVGLTMSCTQTITVIKRYGLQLEAILQGPYQPNRSNGVMSTALNQGNQLPDDQPYNTAPWYYDGEETLPDPLPEEVVDWMLVELRSTAENVFIRKAVLINEDGSIVTDFEEYEEELEEYDLYYIALHHRNHLPVMSAVPVGIPITGNQYDFTQIGNVYLGGAVPLEPGRSSHVGLIAGNSVVDDKLAYSGPGNDRGPILSKLYAEAAPPPNINSTISDGYWMHDVNMNNVISYLGYDNDRSPILANIIAMTGTNLLTTIYHSVVPGTYGRSQQGTPGDGPVHLQLAETLAGAELRLITTDPITDGILDNLQFTLAWQSNDVEIAQLLQGYSSSFMLQPQGEPVTLNGISYQTFAMALPLQLPANWMEEQLSVLEFTSEAYANIQQRLWIANDDYTASHNAMYYISIWGTDHTGQIMGTAVSVDEQLTDYSIRLYPNPVNQGRLNLAFRGIETQELEMHIMDAKGKQIMAESFEASAQQTKAINIQHLQPGVYMLQLRSSKLVYQQKFVVVR